MQDCKRLVSVQLIGCRSVKLFLSQDFFKFSKHQPSGRMLSISRNVNMFVCVSVCLSVCVSVCLCVCVSVSKNFNMALNFSTIIFTSNMHIISSVLLIKADIFYFYNFDLGGHFRGRWGHSKPEKTLIRKLYLNLRVYIKNAYYIICSTNQGQYFLYLWLWPRRSFSRSLRSLKTRNNGYS